MSVDMLSPLIFPVLLIKAFYKLRSSSEEIRMYGKALEDISLLLSDIICARKTLSTAVALHIRGRADREIEHAELALQDARRAVGWNDGIRGETRTVRELVEWALKHTYAAKVHMESLSRCYSRLVLVSDELAKANERRPWPKERVLQEIRAKAITSLTKLAIGCAIAYSGPGEQAPQQRLLGRGSSGIKADSPCYSAKPGL